MSPRSPSGCFSTLHMLQKWAVQTESSPLQPVLPLSQLSHPSSLLLVLLLLLQMQAGSGEKKAKMPARPTRRQSAAAVAAAGITTLYVSLYYIELRFKGIDLP